MLLHCVLNTVLLGALAAGAQTPAAPVPEKVSLAGEWRFALDPKNEGLTGNWFQRDLTETIQLPATTDEAQKGALNEATEAGRLTRLHPYVGAAWYQRDLDVPRAWAGKRVVLTLERTKASRVWLDGKPVGEQASLVAPHVYVLGKLLAGKHRLTVCVNNAQLPPIGDAHQISDQTQTNWNGILGELSLSATDRSGSRTCRSIPTARRTRSRWPSRSATPAACRPGGRWS
jgi:beta-galactosidase